MEKNVTKQTFKSILKPYTLNIVILSFVNVIASLIALFFAYYSKDLIDNIIGGQLQKFIFFAVLLSIFLVVNLVSQAIFKYLLTRYTNQAIKDLKSSYFNHLLRSAYDDRKIYHTGTLMTHLENDVELVAEGIMSLIPRFLFFMARFIGAFVMLMLIEPTFSVVFVILGILLFVGSRIIAPQMRKRHVSLQQAKDHERSLTQESLENIDVIKSFAAEENFTRKQSNAQKQVNRTHLQKTKLSIYTSSGINLFFAFGYAFALIFGGYRLQYGLSVGYLIAMIQLIQHLQTPFSGLSLLYPKFQSTLASIERLDVINALMPEITSHQIDPKFDYVEAKDITYAYDSTPVISKLSFKIYRNQTVMIKGASGIGKSTLIRLMLGFMSKNEGVLQLVIDRSTIDISSATRSLFGYVPQNNLILSGSVRDNLNIFRIHDEAALYKVLKDVSLYDDIVTHPEKLDMPLKEKGAGLSEGQLQRLAIARALLKDAPILLLDEVTSALDQATELKLLNHLKSLPEKTILMITHHDLDVTLFDQIIDFGSPNK